jgi:hypothetical protein
MLAVERAMAQGMTYDVAVYEFAMVDLGPGFFSAEDLASGIGKVEHGYVGMEIYFARCAYRERLKLSQRREAVEAIVVGTVLKNKEVGSHRYSKLTVLAVNLDTGFVDFLGVKRGSASRYTFSLPATHQIFA